MICHVVISLVCFHRTPELVMKVFRAAVKHFVIKDEREVTRGQTFIKLAGDIIATSEIDPR